MSEHETSGQDVQQTKGRESCVVLAQEPDGKHVAVVFSSRFAAYGWIDDHRGTIPIDVFPFPLRVIGRRELEQAWRAEGGS